MVFSNLQYIRKFRSKISGRVCPGVKVDQIINFYAKVTLNECKAGGDIAVSIGVYGYNSVSGNNTTLVKIFIFRLIYNAGLWVRMREIEKPRKGVVNFWWAWIFSCLEFIGETCGYMHSCWISDLWNLLVRRG